MVFDHRHVDEPVGLDEVPENGPLLQHRPPRFTSPKSSSAGSRTLAPAVSPGLPDARPQEAPARVVTRDIGHCHLGCSRRQAEPHHLADQSRIRVRALGRCPVPTDVRLQHDTLTRPGRIDRFPRFRPGPRSEPRSDPRWSPRSEPGGPDPAGTSKLAAFARTVRRFTGSRLWKTSPVVPVTAARATAGPVFFRKSLRSILFSALSVPRLRHWPSIRRVRDASNSLQTLAIQAR